MWTPEILEEPDKEPEKLRTKHTCAVKLALGKGLVTVIGRTRFCSPSPVVDLCCALCGWPTGPSSVLQAAPEALLLPSGSCSSSAESGSSLTTLRRWEIGEIPGTFSTFEHFAVRRVGSRNSPL